jgi:hypothetical protein
MKTQVNGKLYDLIPVHPEAERYPWLSDDELTVLAADIAANGQREPISLLPDGRIVDGRNRWLACQIADVEPECVTVPLTEGEIPAFVKSKNAHRRHLTREQVRELIATALAKNPDRSNRAIGDETGTDGKTVARVRAALEATEEIPQLATTRGKDEKVRKAKRTKPKPARDPDQHPFADLMGRTTALAADLTRAVNADDDYGLKLRIAMTVCGLLDYPGDDPNGAPRFLPLLGFHALLDLAGQPGKLPSEQNIRLIYDKANGTWIPPLTARRRAVKKAKRDAREGRGG